MQRPKGKASLDGKREMEEEQRGKEGLIQRSQSKNGGEDEEEYSIYSFSFHVPLSTSETVYRSNGACFAVQKRGGIQNHRALTLACNLPRWSSVSVSGASAALPILNSSFERVEKIRMQNYLEL